VTWLIHLCDITYSFVWHDLFICVAWLVHVCDMTRSCLWRDSFICVTWLIHVRDMTHSYVWHAVCIRATWLIRMLKGDFGSGCGVVRESSHVTHMNESCHTYERVMSHVWMRHVTRMNESCRTYEWDMSHIWTSHVAHMNESCHTYERVMSHIRMSHVTHMNESSWHTYMNDDVIQKRHNERQIRQKWRIYMKRGPYRHIWMKKDLYSFPRCDVIPKRDTSLITSLLTKFHVSFGAQLYVSFDIKEIHKRETRCVSFDKIDIDIWKETLIEVYVISKCNTSLLTRYVSFIYEKRPMKVGKDL